MKVSVYLASRPGNREVYKQNAYNLGKLLAQKGIEVVYGGSKVGCMGALFEGARDGGGKITGVFPAGFTGRKEYQGMSIIQDGGGYPLYNLVSVANFDERIRTMENLADACVLLPGSHGSMHEFFSFFEGKVLGRFDKPVFILNTDGYYNPLIELIKNMQDAGFSNQGDLQSIIVKDNPTDLVEAILKFA